MMMSNSQIYAQYARDEYRPTKSCTDCVLIDYDNTNGVTGTPPTAVGTLPPGLSGTNFQLVFADEFNVNNNTLNVHQNVNEASNEDYPYEFNQTNKKWRTKSGNLNMGITKSTNTDYNITAGRLKLQQRFDGIDFFTTQFTSNAYIRYGYFEARIKIPGRTVSPTKMFPAFWLNRGNMAPNYCIYEEIDIFEFFQGAAVGVGGSINDKSTKSWYQSHEHYDMFNQYPCDDGYRQAIGKNVIPLDDAQVGAYYLDMTKDFFIWGAHWRSDSIIYYLNNKRVGGMVNKLVADPTKQELGMNIILNCGVHGAPMDNGMIGNPTQMEIDYVRVYKSNQDFTIASPPKICINGSAYTNQWGVEDYLPGASYYFSIKKPDNTFLITESPATDDEHKYYFNVTLPSNTPAGIDTVVLKIIYPHPVTGTMTTRYVKKLIEITTGVPPVTPIVNAGVTLNRCQTFSIGNHQSENIYSWWSNNLELIPQTPTPTGSGTWRVCCGEQISGTLNGTIYVQSHNYCGLSPIGSKTVNTNCYCPTCTVRLKADTTETHPLLVTNTPCEKGNLLTNAEESLSETIPKVLLSPNPCDAYLQIDKPESLRVKAGIYTWEGFKVKEYPEVPENGRIETLSIPQGTYYLKLTQDNGVVRTFPIRIIH
ncbi:MAG: family 16 glycosylhydrolase [Bacteroidia bacterium]|nr:family 16 glycosylhydrolase [Bacteroidia bacterium]